MTDRRLLAATWTCLVLAAGLNLAFDATVTRILGVAALLAFIVLGAFAIATPEFLREDGRAD